MHVDVEQSSRLTRGMSVADFRRKPDASAPLVEIALAVDRNGFGSIFFRECFNSNRTALHRVNSMAGRLRTSWCILFSLSGGVFPVLMHAQFIQARNERIAMDTLSAGFDRVLNTFVWKGQLGVSVVDDRTNLVIRQNLRSRFIRTDPVSSQGEYSGLVDIRSRLLGNWSLVSKAVSLVVSDNRSIDLGRMAQHQGLLGLEFSPQHWRLSASGGYELNDQESERDQGFAYSASLESKGLDFEGLNAKVQSSFTSVLHSFLRLSYPLANLLPQKIVTLTSNTAWRNQA